MAQSNGSSPASRRFAHLTERERAGSDSKLYVSSRASKLKVEELVRGQSTPLLDDDAGQPCLKCGERCQGYMPHVWRKTCLICGCSRDQHKREKDPTATMTYSQHLTRENSDSSSSIDSDEEQKQLEKYTWYPPNISLEMVEQYMQSLPEECVPLKGTPGEHYRSQQFIHQHPPQDLDPESCHKLTDQERKRMAKFAERRKNRFHGVGTVELQKSRSNRKVCSRCTEAILPDSVYITAERAGSERVWHPQCFRCETCKELLVDLIYYYSPENENVFCGRHHGDILACRCYGCDELIFSPTLTEADGKTWHLDHFCCNDCDRSLHKQPHAYKNGKFLCEQCFLKYAEKCQKCREPIALGSKKLSNKGKCWHEACFICKRCREELQEQRYFLVDGDLFCGECVQPIAQCHGCKGAISPTVSYLQHKMRCWHAECFKCVTCHTWLVDGQFQELDDSLLCHSCYVEKVSKKCVVCNKSVIGKAVQFGQKVYHAECFVCAECGVLIGGQNGGKIKERKGDPICLQCNIALATKCFKCQKPITSRHTVYKNHPFHLECFTCNVCNISIATGAYYETSIGQILCVRCANT